MAVLVVTASISGYLVKDWSEQLSRANSSVSSAKQSAVASERAYKELSEVLTEAYSSDTSLQTRMSNLVLDIYNNRIANGVTVSTATPSKLGAAGMVSSVDSLAEVVPGTNVQSIRINVKGSYLNYQGLLNYVASFQRHPVSIVHLKVEGDTFHLGVRLYGQISNG